MDERFREDENELPYLVSEKRDAFKSPNYEKQPSDEEKIDATILFMNTSPMQKSILRKKLLSFLNAPDVKSFEVENWVNEYLFIFTRKNEYISTTDSFKYSTDIETERIFTDCYTTHNYDRLLRNPRFNEVIRKTGMEFIECRGGYVTDFTFASDNFEMKDELDLRVVFKAGSKKRVYDLDLKKMELSERYFEY